MQVRDSNQMQMSMRVMAAVALMLGVVAAAEAENTQGI